MKLRCPSCRKKLELNKSSCVYCGNPLDDVHVFTYSDQVKIKEAKTLIALSIMLIFCVFLFQIEWIDNSTLLPRALNVLDILYLGLLTTFILYIWFVYVSYVFKSFMHSDSSLFVTSLFTCEEYPLEGAFLVQSPVDRINSNHLLITRAGAIKLDNSIVNYAELIHLLKVHAKVVTTANLDYINIDVTDIIPFDCHPSKNNRFDLQILILGALFFLVLGIGVTINEGLSISTGLLSSLAILIFILAIWFYCEVIRKVTVDVEGITYYKLFRFNTLPYSEIQTIQWRSIPFISEGLLIIGNGKKLKVPDVYDGFRPLVESLRKNARIEDDSDTVDIPMRLETIPATYWLRIFLSLFIFLCIEILSILVLYHFIDKIFGISDSTFVSTNLFYTIVIIFLTVPTIALGFYTHMRRFAQNSIEFGISEIVQKSSSSKSTVIPVDELERIELINRFNKVNLRVTGAGKTININSIFCGLNMYYLHDALVRCYAKTQTESE